MDVKELRIGNYLERPNGNIAHVTWGVIKDVEARYRTYTPIPITEEWLVKFGFVKLPDREYLADQWGIGAHPLTDDYLLIIKSIDGEYFYQTTIFQLKYIHSLQNLYFALTGEELTIEK